MAMTSLDLYTADTRFESRSMDLLSCYLNFLPFLQTNGFIESHDCSSHKPPYSISLQSEHNFLHAAHQNFIKWTLGQPIVSFCAF